MLFFAIVAISMVGSVEMMRDGGNTRYMLSVLPIFFAMAAIMRRKPVVLALVAIHERGALLQRQHVLHYVSGRAALEPDEAVRLREVHAVRRSCSDAVKQAPWTPGSPAPED